MERFVENKIVCVILTVNLLKVKFVMLDYVKVLLLLL